MVEITKTLYIPDEEISFTASRSSGPGGQNVNKVNTRVTLIFDIEASPSLSPDQKTLLTRRLGRRVNKDGVLRIVSQQSRSQWANRQTALELFVVLLRKSLEITPRRKKSRIPQALKKKRLADKRRTGEKKRARSRNTINDEFRY